MFVTKNDLGNIIYEHQLAMITENDESIITQALQAAEDEVRGYLTENNKREHLDGRLRYDVDAIFNTSGAERNALLLRHTVTIAKWYLVELCNAEMMYEQVKERYDRATSYLKKLAKGDVNIQSLPQITPSEEPVPFRSGGRTKFNHDY